MLRASVCVSMTSTAGLTDCLRLTAYNPRIRPSRGASRQGQLLHPRVPQGAGGQGAFDGDRASLHLPDLTAGSIGHSKARDRPCPSQICACSSAGGRRPAPPTNGVALIGSRRQSPRVSSRRRHLPGYKACRPHQSHTGSLVRHRATTRSAESSGTTSTPRSSAPGSPTARRAGPHKLDHLHGHAVPHGQRGARPLRQYLSSSASPAAATRPPI